MAILTSFQNVQSDRLIERERERALAAERRREIEIRRQERARESGLSVDEFSVATQKEIAQQRQKLSEIESASDVYYFILIFAAIFKSSLTIITVIPIIGIAFSVVISLFLMILNVILLFVARSAEPAQIHGRFYMRLIVLLMFYILDTLLPLLAFFVPFALFSTISIYLLVKRDRRIARKRIEKKLEKLGALLEA